MSHQNLDQSVARRADLTGTVCPMTFFKAKLLLDQLAPGDLIELTLKGGDQMQSVSKGIKEEGHRIQEVRREGDRYVLLVRRS